MAQIFHYKGEGRQLKDGPKQFWKALRAQENVAADNARIEKEHAKPEIK